MANKLKLYSALSGLGFRLTGFHWLFNPNLNLWLSSFTNFRKGSIYWAKRAKCPGPTRVLIIELPGSRELDLVRVKGLGFSRGSLFPTSRVLPGGFLFFNLFPFQRGVTFCVPNFNFRESLGKVRVIFKGPLWGIGVGFPTPQFIFPGVPREFFPSGGFPRNPLTFGPKGERR